MPTGPTMPVQEEQETTVDVAENEMAVGPMMPIPEPVELSTEE